MLPPNSAYPWDLMSLLTSLTSMMAMTIAVLSILLALFIYAAYKALIRFPWLRPFTPGQGDPLTEWGIKYEEVEFKAFDTDHLIRGWWVPAAHDNDLKISIIALHGSGRDKHNYFQHIRHFHEIGLNSLIFDCRESLCDKDQTGKGLGYSFREHKDVRAAIHYVKNTHTTQSKKLIVTGISMGAASVVVACSKDRELIDGVIAEACYSHPKDAWQHNIERNLKEGVKAFASISALSKVLPTSIPKWLMDAILSTTMSVILRSEHNLHESDVPVHHIANISPKPVMLIHNTRDNVVPYRNSLALIEAAREPKELWTIDNGQPLHVTAIENDLTNEYIERLNKFIESI
ncbi:hypothetical protein SAMD00019534_067660 [Acytostelium subglobosum LB1]|uniref:hypothetical protein n=1 Tax=Acytostelium subglobosum LB1 TaxID=1410327 RepID=UPI000644E80C|nr:hypothetical protein SAMD00019534_125290 [Acytostelium subglobosum LB1]XP_012753332.1 hypothetical protein SAMD00019534_067660 [Acytostelium subglobosum LB1]GAM23591.1 hypothetical protein SAMD00019534_067660 [Acytostelium subglobosum LB1]GAM29353.1 hypothetical protein SAMD00019534_125290 [Acytostelium subglobosum LB1]|eukprot:XP_012747707.1 hypothetical protein SAMD00019534_125290 [Acytostelium subglobosum LB1]